MIPGWRFLLFIRGAYMRPLCLSYPHLFSLNAIQRSSVVTVETAGKSHDAMKEYVTRTSLRPS